jgi:hypothetical protein
MKDDFLGSGGGTTMILHWRRTLILYIFTKRAFYCKALLLNALPYK